MKQIFKKYAAAFISTGLLLTAVPMLTAVPASAAQLLLAEFETTNDGFTARGAAEIQWVELESETPPVPKYSMICGLHVYNREKEWAGAGRDVSSMMKGGSTYDVSAAVYQASGEPVAMKLSVEYKDASGTTHWDHPVGSDDAGGQSVPSGEWTVLSNSAYTLPEGATNMLLYVETDSSLTDFYIDAVSVKGAPSQIKTGDANGDLSVNVADAVALMRFLTTRDTEVEAGADMDGDSSITAADLTLLKQFILDPPKTEVNGDWDNYQETATPAWQQVYKDGIYRLGNTSRIRDKIAKAQSGEKVTIGYLGGSITAGGSADSKAKSYAELSYNYFKTTFGSGNNVVYVNAGESGTSSIVGNIRVDKQVFSQNCDIIFIEFAVNDQGGDRFEKSYESLVKKCLSQPNEPAVILITLCRQDGGSCQDWMAKIGENYDLPVISGKDAVMNGMKAGTIKWTSAKGDPSNYGSGDNIHPGNGGHQIIADLIGYYYRQALRSENVTEPYEIPTTVVRGADYYTSKLVNFSELQDFNPGSWQKTGGNALTDATYKKNGNQPMTFTINGRGVLLLFQSKDDSSFGAVNVTANGKTTKVSSNLKWTWGGMDADVGYYQPNPEQMTISISGADGGSFTLYGISIIE